LHADAPALPTFPTRRSSDLGVASLQNETELPIRALAQFEPTCHAVLLLLRWWKSGCSGLREVPDGGSQRGSLSPTPASSRDPGRRSRILRFSRPRRGWGIRSASSSRPSSSATAPFHRR